MSKSKNGGMNKINKPANTHTHTRIQEIKNQTKEMVALGHHSDFGLY